MVYIAAPQSVETQTIWDLATRLSRKTKCGVVGSQMVCVLTKCSLPRRHYLQDRIVVYITVLEIWTQIHISQGITDVGIYVDD